MKNAPFEKTIGFTDQDSTHKYPHGLSDRSAYLITRGLRIAADLFFRKRYGHRAVVLETVAAVPGMVAGMLHHFKSLRNMTDDDGIIKELLDEAENERMHLMTFIEISKPTLFERLLVLGAQIVFGTFYFFLYVFFRGTAHRMIGYFEDEAVKSYTDYLERVESGELENFQAPILAIQYYGLDRNAKLSDLIKAVREDEQKHSKVNHSYADQHNN